MKGNSQDRGSKGDAGRRRPLAAAPEVVERLRQTFQALADPTRIRIILRLAGGEMCVSDLAGTLGLTMPTISHQLRLLRHLGLVRARREGRMAFYRLDDEHLTHWLEEGVEHLSERAARGAG